MPGSGDNPELQSTLNHLLMRRPGCRLNYLKYSPTERQWQHTGSAVQPRLSELNYEKDKCTLTAISSCWTLEEASCPVDLSVCTVEVPPTAPVQSVCHNRNSKTDPEALVHLNLYGSPIADDSTLCTQWQEGL